MMRAAGLEWYEQGDVWHHVITEEHRSTDSDVPADRLDARAQEIRPLHFADSDVLLRPGGLLEPSPSGPPPSAPRGRNSAVPFRPGRWTAG
ncbi:hypothetical protein QF035_002225 [Streptomyces umbrinus]|uniref:Uncharacterized protein n=1 Tax=Streptomyces umbrinus TaxID=67370 RepID=A0ABU0SM63_9ACTN|nr:hypothetical protein [Streptomyces umbrinus]